MLSLGTKSAAAGRGGRAAGPGESEYAISELAVEGGGELTIDISLGAASYGAKVGGDGFIRTLDYRFRDGRQASVLRFAYVQD